LFGRNDGPVLLLQCEQALLLFVVYLEEPLRQAFLFFIGFLLHIDPLDDVVDIKGKLLVVEFLGIGLADFGFEQGFQILVFRDISDRGIDGVDVAVGPPFEPAQPRLDVPARMGRSWSVNFFELKNLNWASI